MSIFVAEFTTNHLGNLNLLLKMVREAKNAGADFIKMQKKHVESFYSREKLDSKYDSPYGKTFRDYRTIFEFNKKDYERLDEECKSINISWFSTVQDIPSLIEMLYWDLPIYKVASCNSQNIELLKEMERLIPLEKEIVISVAGKTISEISKTISIFKNHKLNILHCVAEYPCKISNCKLGNISILKKEFESDKIKIGYSGHEEGISASLKAINLGAAMVERHFCLSRNSFAHHIECSLTPIEFKEMVNIGKSEEKIKNYFQKNKLDKRATNSGFYMSESEKKFLLDNNYNHQNQIRKNESLFH